MELGKKIKRLRQEKNLTQDELASRCELSKGFISQLERDLTSPSITTLVDILESLGTSLKEFFNETEEEKIVFTPNDFFELVDDELKYILKWVVPNAQKNIMEPIIIKLQPGGRYKEEVAHQGEEFGYVLSGTIYIHFGNKKIKAKKGEVFYFKSNVNHYISNSGKNASEVVWITSPPSF